MKEQQFYSKPTTFLESTESTTGDSYFTSLNDKKNPWDLAHQLRKEDPMKGYIEPDMEDQNPQITQLESLSPPDVSRLESVIADDDYDADWSYPTLKNQPVKKFWHLEDAFSQLKSAMTANAGLTNTVRIAHFDTGYDSEHTTYPGIRMRTDLQKNFVENNGSARDTGSEGLLKQPGHGTGTLSILSGNKIAIPDYSHDDYIGVHEKIEIVPIRVSNSVVLWKNKAFVEALEYVISLYDDKNTRCHIVTMSMGGMPSKAWADVVNKAYEKGIFIVTAGGNNFGRATPNTLVYPARFERVVAACGVSYDYSPYYKPFKIGNLKAMEGNFGPRKAMTKAIAAFTPNVAWAVLGKKDVVSINGAGTSSATPQIAAAAALYYQKYFDDLENMPNGWQRVETLREALFKSASRSIAAGFNNDISLYFGNGIVQANNMLAVKPTDVSIQMTEAVTVNWPFLKLLTGTRFLESPESIEMYEVEILQLISKSASLQHLMDGEEKEFDALSDKEQRLFFSTILEMNDASDALKTMILDNKLY